jgi:L-rhamnose mutarotase
MIRKASVMTVYPDKYEEYEKRHDELWPEMKAALKEHGAHNYSIFLEKSTGKLFAYLEVEDEKKYAEIAKTEICQKWWDYMEPLMETNEDNSPVSVDLEEVFHLD